MYLYFSRIPYFTIVLIVKRWKNSEESVIRSSLSTKYYSVYYKNRMIYSLFSHSHYNRHNLIPYRLISVRHYFDQLSLTFYPFDQMIL